MVKDFKELDFSQAETAEKIFEEIKSKLDSSSDEMINRLSEYTKAHADELAIQFVTIAPLGNYENLLETNEDMSKFLREEAYQTKHWHLLMVEEKKQGIDLLKLVFANKAADDGTSFKGYVFLNKSGKICHVFAHGGE